jgi:hypothetical protein
MDSRSQRLMRAGERTRFQAGNRLAVGHGRPRTGRIRAKFRKLLNRWGQGSFVSNFAQVAESIVGESVSGNRESKKDARELIRRIMGPELAKEIQETVKRALEDGRLRIYRYPEKVRVPRQTAEKQASVVKNTRIASIEGVSQEFQPIPRASVHETARNLMGITEDQAPAPAKRSIKVSLW